MPHSCYTITELSLQRPVRQVPCVIEWQWTWVLWKSSSLCIKVCHNKIEMLWHSAKKTRLTYCRVSSLWLSCLNLLCKTTICSNETGGKKIKERHCGTKLTLLPAWITSIQTQWIIFKMNNLKSIFCQSRFEYSHVMKSTISSFSRGYRWIVDCERLSWLPVQSSMYY